MPNVGKEITIKDLEQHIWELEGIRVLIRVSPDTKIHKKHQYIVCVAAKKPLSTLRNRVLYYLPKELKRTDVTVVDGHGHTTEINVLSQADLRNCGTIRNTYNFATRR